MVFAPRKTPAETLEKINAAINKVMADPQLAREMSAQGVVFTGGSIQQAQKYLAGEVSRWGKIIKDANIKAD
jgi:tripartite-type tricarboxylate transporter receptor subunit TctC